jgi:molybdopterin synthase sulfur carrier subunit
MEIKCFGISKDIVGSSLLKIDPENITNVADLKEYLKKTYPEFNSFKSFMVAVNESYADDDLKIFTKDEIAIIPPVSGG